MLQGSPPRQDRVPKGVFGNCEIGLWNLHPEIQFRVVRVVLLKWIWRVVDWILEGRFHSVVWISFVVKSLVKSDRSELNVGLVRNGYQNPISDRFQKDVGFWNVHEDVRLVIGCIPKSGTGISQEEFRGNFTMTTFKVHPNSTLKSSAVNISQPNFTNPKHALTNCKCPLCPLDFRRHSGVQAGLQELPGASAFCGSSGRSAS